ncbi:MAG: ribonuclease P protein component, partial [bacterium]
MLPKKQRLTSVEIEEVMIKGKPLFSDFFVVKFIKNHTLEIAQGFKISAVSPKKPFSTAALRNKARRRIYSALTSFLETQKPKS